MSAWTHTQPEPGVHLHRTPPGTLRRLHDSTVARNALTQAICSAPFEAVFWECRQLRSADDPLTFAIVDSPRLARRRANARPFRQHLEQAAGDPVIAFDNLGGRSRLVAPTEHDAGPEGVHLMRFLRGAPATQIDALWQQVAAEALAWIEHRPLWLSTSGLGVAWLHVRLDPRPKYYTYTPFRQINAGRG
jgi:hypothetical protein